MENAKVHVLSKVAYHNLAVHFSVNPDPIAKISVTSPIVVNMPTRELLAGETKSSFV